MPHTAKALASGKVPAKLPGSLPESQLFGLVYVSAVVHRFGPGEFETALEMWRTRNALSGITGLLLRKNGDVLQYLEGPEPALTLLYAQICVDPRHRGIIQTLRELIARREFPVWPMGYFVVPRFLIADQLPAYEQLSTLDDKAHPRRSSARILIASFWNGGNVRPAP